MAGSTWFGKHIGCDVRVYGGCCQMGRSGVFEHGGECSELGRARLEAVKATCEYRAAVAKRLLAVGDKSVLLCGSGQFDDAGSGICAVECGVNGSCAGPSVEADVHVVGCDQRDNMLSQSIGGRGCAGSDSAVSAGCQCFVDDILGPLGHGDGFRVGCGFGFSRQSNDFQGTFGGGAKVAGELRVSEEVSEVGRSVSTGSVVEDNEREAVRVADGDGCAVSKGDARDGNGVKNSDRGKNYAKNLAKRLKRKATRRLAGASSDAGVGGINKDRSELQRSFDARRIAENKLAVQKAEYQLKRNDYMTKSRVAELEWETRRLQIDQKLDKISEARLGSKPGFAETLVENNISSTSLPSLSKGTISPDSSISVDEVRKMEKLIETLSGQVQSLTTQLNGLQESIKANQRFGGKFDLDENDKIIMPRFKTPDERLEWMANLSDEEMEALGPDYHRDGRKVEDGSRLSFDGYTEDYSLQDEAMKEAGITMIG